MLHPRLRHAVGAAEVAVVGQRHPQVLHRARLRVHQRWTRRRHGRGRGPQTAKRDESHDSANQRGTPRLPKGCLTVPTITRPPPTAWRAEAQSSLAPWPATGFSSGTTVSRSLARQRPAPRPTAPHCPIGSTSGNSPMPRPTARLRASAANSSTHRPIGLTSGNSRVARYWEIAMHHPMHATGVMRWGGK